MAHLLLLHDGVSAQRWKVQHRHHCRCHQVHHHYDHHQVRWGGPKCDGSHMSLKPRALPPCQWNGKQWKLVLPSGLITNVVFITIVIAIVIIIVIVRRHTDLKSLYLKFIKKFLF